jgi:hypothetical protein
MAQQPLAEWQSFGSPPIRKESEDSDAHEATRQHVQQEPTKELFATDWDRALPTSASVVLPPKSHLAVSNVDDPGVNPYGETVSRCAPCGIDLPRILRQLRN